MVHQLIFEQLSDLEFLLLKTDFLLLVELGDLSSDLKQLSLSLICKFFQVCDLTFKSLLDILC